MNLSELLQNIRRIRVPGNAPAVCDTLASEIRERFAPSAFVRKGRLPARPPAHTLTLTAGRPTGEGKAERPWVSFHVDGDHSARLAAQESCHLYAYFSFLTEVRLDDPVTRFARKRLLRPAFLWQRPVFDLYFTQSGRTVRNMDRESYVRHMARCGFTHLEVNRLAFPEGLEAGVPGEVYPRFYTYCAALDQFVDSFLNRGSYPRSYLRANLKCLQENCAAAERYGLIPTLTCFEPRSVPDALLEKYPELRGCRVDHPYRSFKPRYNLAVSHPVVQRHYRELIQNLLRAAPRLGCLSVWSNDSGAGYEYTRTLYVGANGSAYLVREWSDEDIFARAAAGNAVGFLRLLQESAAEINPEFRVATRLEPFGPEREAVMAGLGKGLDVETPTLLATGWDTPYRHPTYPDSDIGPFTVFNNDFLEEEGPRIRRLARRNCRSHIMHAHGPVNNFEPLLGIPSPWLTHEKLAAMYRVGAKHLAHVGGIAPPASAPWSLNQEIFRRFQFDPALDIEETIQDIARNWVGASNAKRLVRAWRHAEKAIRTFMPNPLYFLWGVWYRILIRPLVPDIEAIPAKERAYYEKHLLSTHHNPNRFDLSRDVLFDLMRPGLARKAVQRIDGRALKSLDTALAVLEKGTTGPARAIFTDQLDRLTALRCWMMTRRNVAAWIADVHGYLKARAPATRAACRKRLPKMTALEIENTKSLLALWKKHRTEFMAVSSGKETTFIYDRNFGRHLARKIRLMEKYGRRTPRIDENLMWRVRRLPQG